MEDAVVNYSRLAIELNGCDFEQQPKVSVIIGRVNGILSALDSIKFQCDVNASDISTIKENLSELKERFEDSHERTREQLKRQANKLRELDNRTLPKCKNQK